MSLTIRMRAMTRNGRPVGCPQCSSGRTEYRTAGPVPGWPSAAWCTDCGHDWEDVLITNEVVRAILAASTGRTKATDKDTFDLKVPGQRLEGELHPELTVDDVRFVWRRGLKPLLKGHVRQARNTAKKKAKGAVVDGIKKAASVPAATALRTDWTARAGGYEETEPENSCPAGCERGWFELDSTFHDTRVKCSLCRGTGELPT